MKELPGSLRNTPDLDRWVAVRQDGTIVIYVGKVELGQGILTAFTLIATTELSVWIANGSSLLPLRLG